MPLTKISMVRICSTGKVQASSPVRKRTLPYETVDVAGVVKMVKIIYIY